MAKLYGEIAKSALLTLDKSFSRALGQPLDASEVYYSLEAAKTYAATPAAYIGQKIVVIEDGKITHYSVEDTAGNLKELGAKPVGDGTTITVDADGKIKLANITEAEASGTYNAVLVNGKLTWVKPSTITVEGLDTLITALTGRVDTAEDEIDALQEAVGVKASEGVEATGLYKEIADEKARALAAEKALGERIDGIDYVDNDELTAALGSYVTTESFNTFKDENTQAIANAKSGAEQTAASALATARTEISKEIDDDVKVAKDRADEAYTLADGKVDKGDYATDKKALQDEDAAIREIAEAAKSSIDTFLNSQEIDNTVNTLKELQAEIEKMTDATELATALSSKADKSVVEGIEGRVKAIEEAPYVTKDQLDEVDGKFASYTNTTDMNAALALKADKSVVDAMYTNVQIDTAVQGAKDYADGEIGKVDTALKARIKALEDVDNATQDELDAYKLVVTNDIATAKGEATDYTDTKLAGYYKNTEVDDLIKDFVVQGDIDTAVAAEAKIARAAEKANADAIKAIKDDASIDSFADVVAELAKKQDKLTTGAYATESYVDNKVKALADGAVAQAQAKAQEGVDAAGVAQQKANDAHTLASSNESNLATLTGTVEGHTGTLSTYGTKISGLETTVSGHTGSINTLTGQMKDKADKSALDTLSQTVSGNNASILDLTTRVGTNETAIGNINANFANYYKKSETYSLSEVNDLIKDFATGTDVENAVKAEADRAKAAEKVNADALAALIGSDADMSVRAIAADEINTLIGGVSDADTIENITTLIEYVNENGGDVTGMQTDIDNLQAIVAGIGGENQPATVLALVEQKIDAIPLATLVENDDETVTATEGLILPEDNKFEMAAGKVTAISTDLLVQGSNTLVLFGGSASV
jgi:hypothetical protein